MKNHKSAVLALLMLILCLIPLFSEEKIGEIVYLEDEVEVVRNGETIDPGDVQIGMEIENFDFLSTSSSGYAEIEIASRRAPAFTVKVSPDTTFFFEINNINGKEKTSLGMITGSLSLRVKKITGARELEVRTESATMGVRGTSFEVTTAPGGEVLITCDEGRVSCTDEEGKELTAEPGRAVEKRPGELFQEVPVAVSDLKSFRRNWYAERFGVFRANALKAIRRYAERYARLKNEFRAAYQGLMGEREVLDKWFQEDRRGKVGAKIEMMREKKRLIGHLFKIRRVLFIFERVYFRLAELNAYHNQGYGKGTIRPGLTTDAFFAAFNREKRELGKQMARVRYIVKLYAGRNQGSFPTGGFGAQQAPFGPEDEGKDFFGDDTGFSF